MSSQSQRVWAIGYNSSAQDRYYPEQQVASKVAMLGGGEFALDASLLALPYDTSKLAVTLGGSAARCWKSANLHDLMGLQIDIATHQHSASEHRKRADRRTF